MRVGVCTAVCVHVGVSLLLAGRQPPRSCVLKRRPFLAGLPVVVFAAPAVALMPPINPLPHAPRAEFPTPTVDLQAATLDRVAASVASLTAALSSSLLLISSEEDPFDVRVLDVLLTQASCRDLASGGAGGDVGTW